MAVSCSWESIDVHLLQVLHALLTECSVSNAARRLNQSQPAVSTALRRLRDITGDPLLVRSRNGIRVESTSTPGYWMRGSSGRARRSLEPSSTKPAASTSRLT